MVTCVSRTASAKRPGSPTKPGPSAYISQGMAICAATTKTSMKVASTLSTSRAKRWASVSPSASTRPA